MLARVRGVERESETNEWGEWREWGVVDNYSQHIERIACPRDYQVWKYCLRNDFSTQQIILIWCISADHYQHPIDQTKTTAQINIPSFRFSLSSGFYLHSRHLTLPRRYRWKSYNTYRRIRARRKRIICIDILGKAWSIHYFPW